MCHNLLLLDHLLNFALRQIGNLSCSSGSCWSLRYLDLQLDPVQYTCVRAFTWAELGIA